ncbi:MAG: precorrin-6y C5,15-methyltransferase (decarboxylating) subunit CbiE [Nocardioidaceae bacterium]
MSDEAAGGTSGAVTVVGIGADGWAGLGEPARDLITRAEVVIGSERQLRLVPVPAVRVPLPRPLLPGLTDVLAAHARHTVVVLASGDPMLSGIGSTLVRLLGDEQVRVHPQVSSVSLALARMGWPAESVDVVSLVGRDPSGVLRVIGPGRRVVALSADGDTPRRLAQLLMDAGHPDAVMTVLGDLGAENESRTSATADDWASRDSPRLNIVCVACAARPTGATLSTTPGLPDDAYEHDGQLTKRDVRASALSRLAPHPGQLLWDVGAGAGSIAIEWMRTDPRSRAVAVEADPERADRIEHNATTLGVPGLEVVCGTAPEALSGLPSPDAILVGGGATADGMLERCWDALRPSGRLVAHGVTLETEHLLAIWQRRHGGDLVRIGVERAEPLGSFTSWRPSRPIVSWSVIR